MNKNVCLEFIKEYQIAVYYHISKKFIHYSFNYSDMALLFGVNKTFMTAASIGDRNLSLEHILQFCLFFRVTPMEAFRDLEFNLCKFKDIKTNRPMLANSKVEHVQRNRIASEGFKARKSNLLIQCVNETNEYKRICIKLNIAIQELRIESGVSQKMLASILGLTDNAIRNLEKGITELTYRHIIAYAIAIGIDPVIVFAKADIDWKSFVKKKLPLDVNIFKNSDQTVKTEWKKRLAKIEIQ